MMSPVQAQESNAVLPQSRVDDDGSMRKIIKESRSASKNLDKMADELDWSYEKQSSLLKEIHNCTVEETLLVSRFDERIERYNEIADARFKQIKKEVKQLRERRKKALDEMVKLNAKIAERVAQIEILSYRQGEIRLDRKLDAIKDRKVQA